MWIYKQIKKIIKKDTPIIEENNDFLKVLKEVNDLSIKLDRKKKQIGLLLLFLLIVNIGYNISDIYIQNHKSTYDKLDNQTKGLIGKEHNIEALKKPICEMKG